MAQIAAGTIIETYTVIRHLGQGGACDVWQVQDENYEIKAMKIISNDINLDASTIKMFNEEYFMTKNIKHPNILSPEKMGMYEGKPFIIMPFYPLSLRLEIFKRHGPQLDDFDGRYTEKEIAYILNQLASGIKHLHDKGITHNDLKPSNILIKEVGENSIYVISDFGISTKLRKTIVQQTQVLSEANKHAGLTPDYAAPERYEGKLKAASDIFSLAVLIYQLCDGQIPFGDQAKSTPGLLIKGGNKVPPLPTPYSERLQKILFQGLDVDRQNRPTPDQLIKWTNAYLVENYWPDEIDHLRPSKGKVRKRWALRMMLYFLAFIFLLFLITNLDFAFRKKNFSDVDRHVLNDTFLISKNKDRYKKAVKISAGFSKIEKTKDGYTRVFSPEKLMGVVDPNYNLVIPCEYEEIGHFTPNSKYTHYKQGSKYGLISINNNKTEAIYETCIFLSPNQARTTYVNKYGTFIEKVLKMNEILE